MLRKLIWRKNEIINEFVASKINIAYLKEYSIICQEQVSPNNVRTILDQLAL